MKFNHHEFQGMEVSGHDRYSVSVRHRRYDEQGAGVSPRDKFITEGFLIFTDRIKLLLQVSIGKHTRGLTPNLDFSSK